MQIQLKTKVSENYKVIIKKFDRKLFERLAPKFPKMEIVQFTGSQKGDIVHIRFLLPLKVEWISKIIADDITDSKAYFIDSGEKLPFPLKTWEHHHIVEKISETESYIIDDMRFSSYNYLFTLLLYPMIYFGFLPRKKIYASYFNGTDN